MLSAIIKLFVPKLNGLLLLVALTGFVFTYKIQAEDDCLSARTLCYECDSRLDPNCADPFDFSANATLEPSKVQQMKPNDNETAIYSNRQANQLGVNTTSNETNLTIPQRQPKRLPAATICSGCCVKITSKTLDGGTYVKRTCTSSLQINYFMVGIVCMKESGDRGKMCFCDTDFCNGQLSRHTPEVKLYIFIALMYILRFLWPTLSPRGRDVVNHTR